MRRSVALLVVLVVAAVGCGGGSSGDRIVFRIWDGDSSDGDFEISVMNADGTETYSTGQKGLSPSFGG